MKIQLEDIFYSITNYEEIKNGINRILSRYCINEDSFIFKHDNGKIVITDDKGCLLVPEKILSKNRLSYRFIDIINISIKYFLKFGIEKDETFLDFVNEMSKLILKDIHIFDFNFLGLNKVDEVYVLRFSFAKSEYEIKPKDFHDNNGIFLVYIYIKINDTENKLLLKKAVYRYGNIVIDLLYQMMSFVHNLLNYIKGNNNWDKIDYEEKEV